jgi:hypothetical protein
VVSTWGGTTYGQDVKVQLSSQPAGIAPTVVTGLAEKLETVGKPRQASQMIGISGTARRR